MASRSGRDAAAIRYMHDEAGLLPDVLEAQASRIQC